MLEKLDSWNWRMAQKVLSQTGSDWIKRYMIYNWKPKWKERLAHRAPVEFPKNLGKFSSNSGGADEDFAVEIKAKENCRARLRFAVPYLN